MADYRETLIARLRAGDATAAVIGLGYVGLPLAVALARAGLSVYGLDVDRERLRTVAAGRSYIGDVPDQAVREAVRMGALTPVSDFDVLERCQAAIICVPTPLTAEGEPDVSCVWAATGEIGRRVHAGMLVVLESTGYPGMTEEIVAATVSLAGLTVGQDLFVAFSPERVDPGRADYDLGNTPKLIGGMTPACAEVAEALYSRVAGACVMMSSAQAAEMAKLLENTFRAVNIALANEFFLMCDWLGLDGWEVTKAAATKPYGFTPFRPGPGVGGHCIPVDPAYLDWGMARAGYESRMSKTAAEVNRQMPAFWVDRVKATLDQDGLALEGSRVLALGVAYKAGVRDVRESPALEMIRLLEAAGARVSFHDPLVGSLVGAGLRTPAVALDEVGEVDCVLIATDHPGYDWEWVRRTAARIVDTRGALRECGAGNGERGAGRGGGVDSDERREELRQR